MKLAIASDHAGFDLKQEIIPFLTSNQHEVIDLGPLGADPVDYPDYAAQVAEYVASKKVDRGLLICGSGIGMCMAANRFKGVRAAVLRVDFDAEMSRRHNDANIACLGARATPKEDIVRLVSLWLATPFEGGRHSDRVNKIG